jgi:hypothetical protein
LGHFFQRRIGNTDAIIICGVNNELQTAHLTAHHHPFESLEGSLDVADGTYRKHHADPIASVYWFRNRWRTTAGSATPIDAGLVLVCTGDR